MDIVIEVVYFLHLKSFRTLW